MFKVQSHAARTLSWWYKQKSKIDFSPAYQRKGNLWSDKDKAFLIDSILNEFDLPKIYLADFNIISTKLNEKLKPYAIIDGRQRFEAIFDFFEDKISLNKDFILFSNKNLALAGMKYSQLKSAHPEVADLFDEFNLHVMSVITDEEEKIKDLFVRLNKSKPLTGAELRNAMTGVVPDLIRGIADKEFFKEKIKFSTERGQDINVASKLLMIEYYGGFVDLKKRNLDAFANNKNDSLDFEEYYEAAFVVSDVLDKITPVFFNNDPLLKSDGLIPIIYSLAKCDVSGSELHDFLKHFDDLRNQQKEFYKYGLGNVDLKFLDLEKSLRSINDKGTLIYAYDMMKNEFSKFIGRTI